MAQMTSATGSLPLRLSKGETLVIKDLAGSHTVTGSLAPREDASASVGAGFVVYGPQSSAVTVTISTTGAVDYQVVSGDVTPAPASGGGAVLSKPSAPRRNIVNEQVTFLNNYGDFANPAYPLTGLMKIAEITDGPGVVDHIKIICNANNAWRACELVVYVDDEVRPSVHFQFSHFGLDYQPTFDPIGHIYDNGKMKMKVQKLAGGVSTVECKFLYEIPYSRNIRVYIHQRQPIVTWWTEVSYRPGVSLPYRLKSKSTNNNGPTYARGGTTGFAAAASSHTSPIDGTTAVTLPSYLSNVTPTQMSNGTVNFMTVPAGVSGSLVGFSVGYFGASAASFNYLEANFALYDQSQVAAGISGGNVQARYMSTGMEDLFGSSFYFDEGIGNWGAYYISDYNTGNAVNGPSNATNNLRIVFNPMETYPGGLQFTDGAYFTLVQSATNLVSDPANAVGVNATGQITITTTISMSFLSLWYEFL